MPTTKGEQVALALSKDTTTMAGLLTMMHLTLGSLRQAKPVCKLHDGQVSLLIHPQRSETERTRAAGVDIIAVVGASLLYSFCLG